jgi:hypothetical protein
VDSSRLVFFLAMLHKIGEQKRLNGLIKIDALKKRLGAMLSVDHDVPIEAMRCKWIEIEQMEPVIFTTVIKAPMTKHLLLITQQAPGQDPIDRTVEPSLLYN